VSLDSPATGVTLAAVLLAVIAVTCWRWRAVRFRRLMRFGSLLGIQVLGLMTVLVWVNVSGQYVSNIADLTGSTQGLAAHDLVDRRGDEIDPAQRSDWLPTPGERAADRADAGGSRVLTITIDGAKTGYHQGAKIYLPGSYQADPGRRYPVLQLQSGYPGSARSWFDYLDLKQTLDQLIAGGRMPAVVAVSTSQNVRRAHDSECVDADPASVPGSLAGTFLGVDVPTYLRAHYRVGGSRDDWVIGGYSTGGYCAANLALRHPQTYAAAISLSGYFTPIVDGTTGELYRTTQERDENTPILTARRPHPPTAFFLGAAQNNVSDMFALASIERVIPTTDPLRVATTPSGGHSSRIWRVLSPDAFTWVAATLAR
jgi:enterochelin esterase-like enzyme